MTPNLSMQQLLGTVCGELSRAVLSEGWIPLVCDFVIRPLQRSNFASCTYRVGRDKVTLSKDQAAGLVSPTKGRIPTPVGGAAVVSLGKLDTGEALVILTREQMCIDVARKHDFYSSCLHVTARGWEVRFWTVCFFGSENLMEGKRKRGPQHTDLTPSSARGSGKKRAGQEDCAPGSKSKKSCMEMSTEEPQTSTGKGKATGSSRGKGFKRKLSEMVPTATSTPTPKRVQALREEAGEPGMEAWATWMAWATLSMLLYSALSSHRRLPISRTIVSRRKDWNWRMPAWWDLMNSFAAFYL